MIPKFIHPAFIRKNTPELRKKLEELGYEHPADIIEDEMFCIATSQITCKYVIINGGSFDDTNPHHTWNCAGRIDCGINEDLFLAIASLREDTDVNQWFVMDVEVYNDIPINTWFKATSIEDGKHIGTQIDPMYCHKATVSELIEYFKKKGETK